jgi:Lrp/AsnC family transcriptional regulator
MVSREVSLDTTDIRILSALQHDAGVSTADLAEQVGLSQAPCWRRIRRLETEGVVTRRVALLDRRSLGLNIMVLAQIKLSMHGQDTLFGFEEAMRRRPEVLDCYTLMGGTDYLLRIVVPDVEAYERLYRQHLSQAPGVREITSSIVMSEVKSTTELPLTQAP